MNCKIYTYTNNNRSQYSTKVSIQHQNSVSTNNKTVDTNKPAPEYSTVIKPESMINYGSDLESQVSINNQSQNHLSSVFSEQEVNINKDIRLLIKFFNF